MWWVWLACAGGDPGETDVVDTEVVDSDTDDTDVVDTDDTDPVDTDDSDDTDPVDTDDTDPVDTDDTDAGCDLDGDGWRAIACGGDDCDDADAARSPGATDVPYDGVDQDCDGRDLTDVDGDGFRAEIAGGGDCDDTDAENNPDADEVIDRDDDDCDDLVDRVVIDAVWVAATSGAAIDARIGSIDNLALGDVTGDGVIDLVVGAPVYDTWTGRVYVLDGADVASWTGNIDTDALALDAEATGDELGFVPHDLGDVDGDGIADLVAGAKRGGVGTGRAYLLLGGVTWSDLGDAAATVDAGSGGAVCGWATDAAGDLDGDGLADWAVGDADARGSGGRVGVFTAAPSGSVDLVDAELVFTGAIGERLGEGLLSGDLDDDGYADLHMGAPGASSDAGTVYVLAGGTALEGGEIGDLAGWSVTGDGTGEVGQNSRGIGRPADLDDSGASDLVVADYQGASTVYVFLDPATGDYTASDADVAVGDTGTAIGSATTTGDLDDDGVADLVVGGLTDGTVFRGGGSVWVVWGSSDLADTPVVDRDLAGAVIEADGMDRYLGTAARVGPDWTGDGTPDLALIASWDSTIASKGGSLFVLP